MIEQPDQAIDKTYLDCNKPVTITSTHRNVRYLQKSIRLKTDHTQIQKIFKIDETTTYHTNIQGLMRQQPLHIQKQKKISRSPLDTSLTT